MNILRTALLLILGATILSAGLHLLTGISAVGKFATFAYFAPASTGTGTMDNSHVGRMATTGVLAHASDGSFALSVIAGGTNSGQGVVTRATAAAQ